MSAAKANASALPVDDKRRAHEPSIEEILASIRRIISDDQNARLEESTSEPKDEFDPVSTARPQDRFTGEDARYEPSAADIAIEEEEAVPPYAVEHRRDSILRQLKASNEAQSRGAFRQAAEILEAAERDLACSDALDTGMRVRPGAPLSPRASEHLSPLVSATTAASIAAQFETLAASRLFGDAGRMDDLIRDLLRPMLREWLDDNLPGIVEKLVRAEIERVARGGRG
jgi:cell pole-organizing protein PopZ